MSLNWSLKELYQSFGSNEFKNDMNNLTEEISSINGLMKQLKIMIM